MLHIRVIAKDNPDLIYRLQFLQKHLSTSIKSSKGFTLG